MKGSSSSAGARRITAAILMLLISLVGACAGDQVVYEKTAGTVSSDEIGLGEYNYLDDGNLTWQDETNDTGYWEICGLPPGTYTVCEVDKEGWTQTHPVDESGVPVCHIVEITNSSVSNVNFSNRGDFCISGHKYWDRRGNGVRDILEDPPLKNWTIQVRDDNGSLLFETSTDEEGYWEVCYLFPGTYNVSEVVLDGWKPTYPPGGYYNSIVVSSDNVTGIDFLNNGIFCLSGHKYWDRNQNKTRDPDEEYLNGWTISVEDKTNRSSRWIDTTAGNGSWKICNLPPGTYVLDEEAPNGEMGWIASQRPGDVTITNRSIKDIDFGNYRVYHRDEPDQYEQFCESQQVEGTGYMDLKTSVMDKKLAMDYQNQMFGEGDIGMESAQVYSQEPNKLIRPLPNCSDNNGTTLQKLNFFENTKLEYEGETPLVGSRSISSIERYGGLGADVQESFSVRRLEADQTMFLGQTSNSTIRHTVGLNTLNSFNGTWGTQSSLHKIFYKDIRRRDLFAGEFEMQRELKFHENPVCEPKICPCGGVDC